MSHHLYRTIISLAVAGGMGIGTGLAQPVKISPDGGTATIDAAFPNVPDTVNKTTQTDHSKKATEVVNQLTSTPHAMDRVSNTVSANYTIGAEDVLDITVWRNQDLSKQVQVRPDGRISLPVIRDVIAVGKTPTQLADEITTKLRAYVQNPVVAISVLEVNSYSVFLLGEVVKPGKYALKSKTTLLQGITMAGGFTPIAARNQVVVFRFSSNGDGSGTKTLSASYDDIVLRGVIDQNFELMAGDTIVVPSEAMVVFPGQQ